MNITILTQPLFEPVNLLDCYSHLRLDPDDSPATHPDDAMLARHITTARRQAEAITNRAFVRQQLRLSAASFDAFQNGTLPGTWRPTAIYQQQGIPLPRPPFISVEAVSYYDSANALQAIDAADYFVTDEVVPRLQFVNGPSVSFSGRGDGARIDYWVGYPVVGSPDTGRDAQIASVPSEVKDAILIGVELLYEQLTPEQRKALTDARTALLNPLKVHVLA